MTLGIFTITGSDMGLALGPMENVLNALQVDC